MENGMRESLIAIGGVERVRLDDRDIPQYQSISRIRQSAAR